MLPVWLNTLVIIFIAFSAIGVSILIGVLLRKGLRLGQVRVRRVTFDRADQPGFFWLIVGVYSFAALASACFGIFLLFLLILIPGYVH